jgi:hypothetical protein
VAAAEAAPAANRPAAAAGFGALKLASLSASEIQGLLAGRRQFMQNLLADSTQKLQAKPGLADLRACETGAEASTGTCLITARLRDPVQGPSSLPAAGSTPGAAPAAAEPVPAPAAAAPTAASGRTAVRAPTFGAIKRPVRDAALPQIERKIALLVGVDRYDDAAIPTLANAVNDASAVGRVLEEQLGYETLVLPNPTRATLVAALNQLALTAGPRDSVVVYYAGHGELVESTRQGYWLLADSVAKQPETWLSNADINRLIAQMGASQVALVSDSCFSGSLASEERIRGPVANLDPQQVLSRKSVVVMSSGGNEPVFDDGKNGHSPFAWNLMNTLGAVSNWQPGSQVFERVRFAVARALPQRPQYSASRAAGHQPGGEYLFEQRRFAAEP